MDTSYDPETAKVIQLKTEYINPNKNISDNKGKMTYDKVIADMIFNINGKIYGIEFQTVHDNTILCRIAEYQFNAMIDIVKSTGFLNEYEGKLPLPRMTMVQLERSNDVPDQYKLWFVNEATGEKLLQKFPIIKIWEHTIEQLSQNNMHLLLPFKIIDIRKRIKGDEMDKVTTAEFLEMNTQIDNKIMELFQDDNLSYTAMEKMNHAHGSLIRYFNEKFISDSNPMKGDVDNMFAEVMERNVITKADIIREGELRGEEQGKVQGQQDMLNAVAQAGASFKVFKAAAEARGVPQEQYLPIYKTALDIRSKKGEVISDIDDIIPFHKAEMELRKS